MIARSFDGEVVQRRLRMLSDLLDRLESLGQTSAARLESDWQHAAVVERLLTRIVELAIKINTHVVTSTGALPPQDYRQSFLDAATAHLIEQQLAERLAPSAGLRNAIVHDYAWVNLDKVAEGAARALVDYREYVQQASVCVQSRRQAPPDNG
ncbi:MAG: DUF86 domain-containing protein [Euzebyales bacterium]|nr:DUF86 domain-containing protein [Euzebyales bacterium]